MKRIVINHLFSYLSKMNNNLSLIVSSLATNAPLGNYRSSKVYSTVFRIKNTIVKEGNSLIGKYI